MERKTFISWLFQQQASAVRAFLFRKGHNRDEVEDFLQETFLRAHKVTDWGEVQNPRAFLMRIAKNVCNDEYRRQKRDVLEGASEAEVVSIESIEPSPEDAASSRQEIEALEHIVQNLSPRVKQAVILIKVLNVSYAEASEIMGVSVNTLENHITRGMAECRREMSKKFPPASEARGKVVQLANNLRYKQKRTHKED